MVIIKIISGGQTGADQGGLEAGKALGLKTGGTAPMDWKTEKGPMKEFLSNYGLVEAGVPGYPFRTKMNVLNSDGTIIFGNIAGSPGSGLTLSLCRRLSKPVLTLHLEDHPETDSYLFLEWMGKHNIRTLNVAGNRESKNCGIQERVKEFLVQALREMMTAKPEETVT